VRRPFTSLPERNISRLGDRADDFRTRQRNCKRDANERIRHTNPCRPLKQIELRRPQGGKYSGPLSGEGPALVLDGSVWSTKSQRGGCKGLVSRRSQAVRGRRRAGGTRCAYGRVPSLASTNCATCRPTSWSFIRRVRRVMPSRRAARCWLPPVYSRTRGSTSRSSSRWISR
jgi:hypothetical protein